jgi:hypothetical protein
VLEDLQNCRDQDSENNIKFRRRVGQRSRKPRTMVIGLHSEEDNLFLTGKGKGSTEYHPNVNILPDLNKTETRRNQNVRRGRQPNQEFDRRRQGK